MFSFFCKSRKPNQNSEEMASAMAAGLLGRAAKKTRKGQTEAESTEEIAHDSSTSSSSSHATGVEMEK
jgi:hypothetical protein